MDRSLTPTQIEILIASLRMTLEGERPKCSDYDREEAQGLMDLANELAAMLSEGDTRYLRVQGVCFPIIHCPKCDEELMSCEVQNHLWEEHYVIMGTGWLMVR